MGVLDHVSDFRPVTVLTQRGGHVHDRQLLAGWGNAFSQWGGDWVERHPATPFDSLTFVFRYALDLAELVEHNRVFCVFQKLRNSDNANAG